MADILDIPLTLLENNITDVSREVVRILRPEWNYENAVIERSPEGFLHVVLLCYANGTKNKTDALVIKNCNPRFCGPPEDWKKAARFLTKHNLGAHIQAFLDNGLCMKMVDGEMEGFEHPRSLEDDYRDLVAEEMARWHCQEVLKDAKKIGMRHRTPLGIPVIGYWDKMFEEDILAKYRKDFPSEQDIVRTVKDFEEEMMRTGDLDLVFCHVDFNCSNIFTNVDNGKGIEIIDFDSAGLCGLQHEIAWFFRIMRETSQPRFDPGREYEIKFLKHYLQNRNKIDKKPSASEKDVERLFCQVQKAKVLVHLRIIVSSACIFYFNEEKRDEVEKRFIPRAIEYWKEFQAYKDKVFEQYSDITESTVSKLTACIDDETKLMRNYTTG